MKNFQCIKCETHVESANRPASGTNCPSGGHHQWVDLGEVGDVNIQCKKCGLLIQAKSPGAASATNCPSGGHHQWTKL